MLIENFEKASNWNQSNFSLSLSLYSLCSLLPPLFLPVDQRPSASRRAPPARPGRLPATWFTQTDHPNPLGLAMWCHPMRARRGPPSKRHGDDISLRPTALALYLAQDCLDHSTSSQTSLSSSPPCSERESQLHAPLSAWNGRRRHHARRRPLARRRAHPSTHPRAQHHPQLAFLPLTGAP